MLKDKTAESCRTNKIYKEGFVSNVPQRNEHSDIIVESGTTLATARKYLHIGKTAVLNFANPEIREVEFSMELWRRRSVCAEAVTFIRVFVMRVFLMIIMSIIVTLKILFTQID